MYSQPTMLYIFKHKRICSAVLGKDGHIMLEFHYNRLHFFPKNYYSSS